jgi:hypothetical protein
MTDYHDITGEFLRAIVKRDQASEGHREAIVLHQTIEDLADGYIERPLLHPHLLG